MPKISLNVEIDSANIGKLVKRMPMDEKIQLVHELEEETWGKRIDNLIKRIDQRRKKSHVSTGDISIEIKAVRAQIYGKSSN